MKLLRYGPAGHERPGALDAQGQIRDLSLLVPDFTPEWLATDKLAALAAIDLQRMPCIPAGTRLGPPLAGIRQFIGIGLNYRKHAEEADLPIPAEPIVFNKALGAIAGPNDDIPMPLGSLALDWEVELGFVIGTQARNVSADQALQHVAAYCLANDVSEREWQLHRNGQWTKGKSFDGFGPIGPWLLTADELPDPQTITLELKRNGQTMQSSSTADQIFPVASIVAYLSQFMTLMPGDLVITGTPAGVGMGMKPPDYLKCGDVLELQGGPLGTQRQRIVYYGALSEELSISA